MTEQDSRQLLCTFSNSKDFQGVSKEIRKFYKVYSNRIFVFTNAKNFKEIYLTYNVLNMQKDAPKFPNTILIHRKKQTNTLYTLNAMNRLIEEEHGSFDKSYVVNWKLYENSLIITGDVSIRIIPLKISIILD
ncbi:MAG TPA: hypothetical protein PLC59_00290 [Bacteroidales bacterium]|jgi:hypothetical protein|nr:hypothetical protein [Bacteroidales bacterium]HQI44502.1 hypothetical protein [Bacteroidales bacterium]